MSVTNHYEGRIAPANYARCNGALRKYVLGSRQIFVTRAKAEMLKVVVYGCQTPHTSRSTKNLREASCSLAVITLLLRNQEKQPG
uniref:FLYWCH-type domain-containing protein n=1 Tax=Steinernema glaseri TaxID=37863 RepID=A0A1I7YB44_9BILA